YWGVRGGFYSDYLEDWFQVFDDSVKIVFFEQLKNQPTLLLKEIAKWLSLDESIFDSVMLSIENKTVNYNNNLLHKMALLLNTKGEKFLRAYPQFKETVRNIYYALNGKPHAETISEHTLTYLKSVYNPYNKQLAYQLSLRGYTDFPNWLHE
ncbi:MAG: hypothetical protein F6K28_27570, partial [Microcoleus sp. SIO2G3]|nr:hypothetical protein [Microcoleus sp. SIO2G3]